MSGHIPCGFKCSYIVPIPNVKYCHTKSLTCNDFRVVAKLMHRHLLVSVLSVMENLFTKWN